MKKLNPHFITKKFMQTLSKDTYSNLVEKGLERGITVQQLIRGVIIPEWDKIQEQARTVGGKIVRRQKKR